MSLFVSNEDKRDIRTGVFIKMFANVNNPDLFMPPVLSLKYLQTTYPEKLYPIISAERLVLSFLKKISGSGYGSIPYYNLYSAGRKLFLEVLNNDPSAIKKIILTNGFYYNSTLPSGFYDSARIRIINLPRVMSADFADRTIASGADVNYFSKYGTLTAVNSLISGAGYVSELLNNPSAIIIDDTKKKIESLLSGYLRGIGTGAALAILGTVPVIGGAVNIISGIIGIFGGKEKQDVAQNAAAEAQGTAADWKERYNKILTIPQAASASEMEVNDILNRAQLYSPLDVYGNMIEKYIGLPNISGYYLAALGRGDAPVIKQETSPTATPLPESAASPEPVSEILPPVIIETHTGPFGITVETTRETAPLEEEAAAQQAAQDVNTAAENIEGVSDTEKQWASAAAVGAGIAAKILGFF